MLQHCKAADPQGRHHRSGVAALFDLTGKTNNATFKRKPTGSVLFKGARGSKRGQLIWEITFEFAYQKNKTRIVIGDVAEFDKLGWQYIETMYKDSPTLLVNGKPLQVPFQVNVHDVYESGDYSILNIGTT